MNVQVRGYLLAAVSLVVLSGSALAQRGAAPSQGKPIATIQGGGVDHDALPFSQLRRVQGTVYNPEEKVLRNAQVYLKDESTAEVRTMLTDDNGKYLFGELPMAHDYTVWASVDGKKTPIKPVSSFIETRQVTVNLRLASNAQLDGGAKAATPAAK